MNYIGITQRLIQHTAYYEIRECLAQDWGRFFACELKDFLPLPLSYEIDFSHYSPLLSGVILSGGNDLGVFCDGRLSQIRDNYEYTIIKHCIKHNIPLLGVCRGAQILAHFFDSTLKACSGHTQAHLVYSATSTFYVNSFHHYCITHLGADLIELVAAERCDYSDRSLDSHQYSIEGFRHKSKAFFGIMWHIEREKGLENTEILDSYLECVKKFKENKQ